MKRMFILSIFMLTTIFLSEETRSDENVLRNEAVTPRTILRDKKWIHGSTDCKTNKDLAIEVFRYDEGSYILRQNKCLNFEAPFIYVLVGDEKVLVLDTGATKSALDFPLYETVRALVNTELNTDRELIVVHSHSHSDHYSGDSQFYDKPNVTIIEPGYSAVTEFFAFHDWPRQEAYLQLGGRKLMVVPTPGHQEEAISIYDPQTKWLLTGDTIYPGYIYIKSWDEYKKSISRLVSLLETRDVSAILGAHIEMTSGAGEYYSIGTTYQPNEASLALTTASLASLDLALTKADKAQKIVLDEFIIDPMNAIQKTISNIARWIFQ